jgi:hypothetical protein
MKVQFVKTHLLCSATSVLGMVYALIVIIYSNSDCLGIMDTALIVIIYPHSEWQLSW